MISFYLKKTSSDTPLTIYAVIWMDKAIRFSTRLKIRPSDWDSKKKMPKAIARRKDLTRLRDDLHRIQEFYLNYDKRYFDIDLFKKELFHKDRPESGVKTIVDILQKKVNELKDNPAYYQRSFEKYNKTISLLKKTVGPIPINRFNEDTFNEFISSLIHLRYSAYYINVQINNIKEVVRKNRNLFEGLYWLDNINTLKRIQTTAVYLDEDKVHQLYSLCFIPSYLEHTRHTLCIGCDIGQRYRDIMKVDKKDIVIRSGTPYLTVHQSKTKKTVYIPLKDRTYQLILSIGKVHPISNQKLNKYIKEIGEELLWTEAVEYSIQRGREIHTETIPFYDLVSSHTCRRSFATNAFMAGLSLENIRRITGHSTEKQLLEYIRASNLSVAENISSHPFFQ